MLSVHTKRDRLGITELVLRYIVRLCVNDDKLKGSQMIVITGLGRLQQNSRDISECYIGKSNPHIAMVSTPDAPGFIFDKIKRSRIRIYLQKTKTLLHLWPEWYLLK